MTKIIQLHPKHSKLKKAVPDQPDPLQYLKDQLKTELVAALEELLKGPRSLRLKKWLSSQQVAKKLHISASTLRRLRENGHVPYCCIAGAIYYDPADIDREVRRRKIPKTG
jgi:hypothetical protein